MNILLIKPFWPYPYSKGEDTYNRVWPPLSLLNCAGLLEKNGFKVKILDAHAERIKPEKIGNYIERFDKIFITSSSLDKWQCPNIDISSFLETVRCIKEATDEVYVMGYHGTVEPERILNLTGAKAVIRGEPESAVLEICKDKALLKISGISFKNNGEFISTPQRELLDLKNLPVPAFHLLNFKKYYYEILGDNFTLFEISRGCKFSCRFCNKIMYGEKLRSKSKEQICKEVTQAVEKCNVKTGYFIDLDFLSNGEIAEALCEYLIRKKYKFKWACQTRPDLLDVEVLKKMKAAGCTLIHMGIETGLQKLLDYLNKNMTIEKVHQAVKFCREAGIKTLAFFIFGLPDETDADRKEILKSVKELNPDFISFHKMVPYKGSTLYRDKFEYKCNAEVNKFIYRGLLKFYLRPSYLCTLNLSAILGGFRLFWGRIGTLR